MTKQRVFSGIKPTGDVHIGNYLGAIKNWVKNQDEFDNIFCIVDLHAITIPQDSKILKEKTREMAGLLLACGIDPEKSTLFIQSHIPAHSEMAWILNCFIPMGWMERMTQFKEKSEGQGERVSVGLFDYPALMAADILLYGAEIVPVGEDQKQHVELARDVAKRFNSIYGDTFKIPKAVLSESSMRIMGLQNPEKKISKSAPLSGTKGSEGNVINLLDPSDDIRKKIMSAKTDSFNEVRFDTARPGIYNLLVVYEAFSGMSRGDIETKFEGKGYAEFKKELAEVIIKTIGPIQEKYKEIMKDLPRLESILKKGAEKVRPLAEETLSKVKNQIGLV